MMHKKVQQGELLWIMVLMVCCACSLVQLTPPLLCLAAAIAIGAATTTTAIAATTVILLLPAAPFLLFLAPQHTTSTAIANAITAAFAVCYHKNPKVLVTAIALDIITTAR